MPNNKKINLLLDTSPLNNQSAIRGIGTYTRLLAENLATMPELSIEQSFFQAKQDGFKPDIVHYPYFDLFFNTLPIKCCAKNKTVVTIHDLIPLKFPDFYPVGLRGKFNFFKQKLALKKVSAIITDSFASKKDIEQILGINPEKIYVIYLASNPLLKPASLEEIKRVKRKFNLPKNYILYVGDINYNKNLPQLIKALKYLPSHIKLLLLGKNFYPHDIPEWQWIETQIALSNVASRVKFLNDIDAKMLDEMSAIYSGASVYVQPSLYEGFGLPVLEAMQCQTPVVASNNSSLLEIGDQYIEFSNSNAEDLADKINLVLNWSMEQRQERVEEAYQWSQSFTWQRTAKETFQVYQTILAL